MSRLTYAADHELAIHAIVEELGVLERHIASGKDLSPEDASQLLDCLGRLQTLLKARDWHSEEEPLPDWLRPLQKQTDELVDKQHAEASRKSATR